MNGSVTDCVDPTGPALGRARSPWHKRRDLAMLVGLCIGCLAFFFVEATSEARILRGVTITSVATGSPVNVPNTYSYRLAQSAQHAGRGLAFASLCVAFTAAIVALSWRRHGRPAGSYLVSAAILGAIGGFGVSIITWLIFGGWGPTALFGLTFGCAFAGLTTAAIVDDTTRYEQVSVATFAAILPVAWLLLTV